VPTHPTPPKNSEIRIRSHCFDNRKVRVGLANCPYVLVELPESSPEPGEVFLMQDGTSLMFFGCLQDGSACCIDRYGEWWVLEFEEFLRDSQPSL